MSKVEIDEVYKVSYKMLSATGIWPNETRGTFYALKTGVTWFFAISLLVTMTMETLNDLNDFTKLSEIIYINVTIAGYVVKIAVFAYKKKIFLNMIQFLKDPIFLSYPEELRSYMVNAVKFSNLLATTYRYAVSCCVISFLVYPFFDNKPIPFPFPYDLGKYNYIIFFHQVVGAGFSGWNNSSLDVLCTSLIGIASAQFDILAGKITLSKVGENEERFELKNDSEVRKNLRQCVTHHLAILK